MQLKCTNSSFIISLLYASTCFEHYVLIIRGQNCIIQRLVSSHTVGGRPVDRLGEDCRAVVMLYNTILTTYDEHIVLETCRGI